MSAIAMSLICAWALAVLVSPYDGWVRAGLRAAGIVAIVLLGAGVARADGAYDLARVTAGEAGLQRLTDDAPAIYRTCQRRAERRGTHWRRELWRYSGGHLRRSEGGPRAWIGWLRPDGHRPRYWPVGRAVWAPRARVWRQVLELARQVVSGEVSAPASCQPDHYGSPDERLPDIHRARAMGGIRQACGETADWYWQCPPGAWC